MNILLARKSATAATASRSDEREAFSVIQCVKSLS